jgi:hypothetical protein
MQVKVCAHCSRTLVLSNDTFPKNAKTKDGYGSWCRDCAREATKWSMRNSRRRQAVADTAVDDPHY